MSAPLPGDLGRELRQTLTDLRAVHLAAGAWPVVAGDLGRLFQAVEHGDDEAVRQALVPISRAVFEGKVRGRLAGSDRTAAYVTATKQTSALPVVGTVSAAILIVVGYLLGGWTVAAGTALFGLFIFGVAYAGSTAHRDRMSRRGRTSKRQTTGRTDPAPSPVANAITALELSLEAMKAPDGPEGEPAAAPDRSPSARDDGG